MLKNNNLKNQKLVIYQAKNGAIELQPDSSKETIWASQKQIAGVFDVNSQAITKHIKNIYQENELLENSTCSKLEQVHKEGNRPVKRTIKLYNLDAIISIGYRVNSKKATKFRIWATKTLRGHLLQGYSLNEKRLSQVTSTFQQLQQTVGVLAEKEKLIPQDLIQEVIGLFRAYSKSLFLLDSFDSKKLPAVKPKKVGYQLTYEEAGKELYEGVATKAANLLYLIIKDHPFLDGNKRSAIFLFVYFLQKNNFLYRKNQQVKINDNALIALALLVAISDAKDKDLMIKLIENLLS